MASFEAVVVLAEEGQKDGLKRNQLFVTILKTYSNMITVMAQTRSS